MDPGYGHEHTPERGASNTCYGMPVRLSWKLVTRQQHDSNVLCTTVTVVARSRSANPQPFLLCCAHDVFNRPTSLSESP